MVAPEPKQKMVYQLIHNYEHRDIMLKSKQRQSLNQGHILFDMLYLTQIMKSIVVYLCIVKL